MKLNTYAKKLLFGKELSKINNIMKLLKIKRPEMIVRKGKMIKGIGAITIQRILRLRGINGKNLIRIMIENWGFYDKERGGL